MEKYELNLARKLAQSFHNTTGFDRDELFAEAVLGYAEALQVYKPKKGKLSTWVYACMQNRLIEFLKKERKEKFISRDAVWMDFPIDNIPFFELLDSLSSDSKIIVQMILDNPLDYLEVPSRMARGIVVQNLIVKHKWTWARVWSAIRNIKLELSNS